MAPEPHTTTNLATLYDQQVMPWSRAATALGTGALGPEPACFLGTTRPDGRPHAAGVGVTVHDLVLEGEARRETDPTTLTSVAAVYDAGGWPAQADGDGITAPYSAQSAGPGPWHLYRFRTRTAFGVGLRPPHGASRWDF